MPAGASKDTHSEPKRETWRDWMPDGLPEPPESQLLTRDELAERLQARGFDISADNIRYWEQQGVLPRPVRRWHKGATRSTYPPWMTTLAIEIRRFQDDDFSLDKITPRIRRLAERLLDGFLDPTRRHLWSKDVEIDDTTKQGLLNLVPEVSRRSGSPVAFIEVAFVTEDGAAEFVRLVVPPTASWRG